MNIESQCVSGGKERKGPAVRFQAVVTACMAGCVLITGCSVGPKYVRPTVQVPAAFKEAKGWKMAQPRDNIIRGKWWEMFNDPQLNVLEEQVNISNQSVRAAFENFLAARAVVKQARSGYFPTVTTSPSVTYSKLSSSGNQINLSSGNTIVGGASSSGNTTSTGNSSSSSTATFTSYSLPFDASWAPDLWGAIRNTVKADIFADQASAANLENVRLIAQAELAVDYYELRGQDSLKQLLHETVLADQKTLELTRALYHTGIDSDQSVAQAETQLAIVVAQETSVGIQRAQFEHAIALLAGQSASTFSISVEPLKARPPAMPVGLPSELLERRPDIALAERSVAQANAQIGVAQAAYFPTLTLNGSTGFQNSSLANLFSGPSFVWSVGGTLAETLFDAGRRRAVTEQARANYRLTVANYRQTVLTAFQGVEDNLAALRILAQELQQQEAAVKASERNLALAMQRYSVGIDSYLNVIIAQTTLLTNQQTVLTIHIQQMTASVQLVLALGGGWNASQLPSPGQIISKTPLAP
ncbi:MAG: efflux system, outer rane lipoprotein NodT [Pedosphaera sp.]|nr:efflux system, outer rane lipoprotein NodT [Pedosphaera sp.]